MSETIAVEQKVNGHWREYQTIDDADIRDLHLTPDQVAAYVQQHPSPLAKLFAGGTEFRVVYSVHEETSRFVVTGASAR